MQLAETTYQLDGLPGLGLRVRDYAPGASQEPHRDERSHLSAVLQGGFSEETRLGTVECTRGDLLLKAHTVRHRTRFSARTTRILSIDFDPEEHPFEHLFAGKRWHVQRDRRGLRCLVRLLEALPTRSAGRVEAPLLDLISGIEPDAARRTPPAWLARLAAELESEGLAGIDVAGRARKAGVHPVHASRLFRACFGRSITDHAGYHAVRRALSAMEDGEARLSDVSLTAGFFDQSHMARFFRRVLDRPPGACRRAFTLAAPSSRAGSDRPRRPVP